MEMRVLIFNGESYPDEDRQSELIERTLEAIDDSGVTLNANEVSEDRSASLFLVSGEPAAIRRLWSIVEASGLENHWEDFGSRLDWSDFQTTS